MNFTYKTLVKFRAYFAISHDLIVGCLAWFSSFALRFNFNVPAEFLDVFWASLIIVVPIQIIFFYSNNLYKGVWRFASTLDLKNIVYAVFLSAVLVAAVLHVWHFTTVPRTVLFLNPILLIIGMGGSRFAYREWQEYRHLGARSSEGEKVVILGVDHMAMSLLKDLTRNKEWNVVGLLDDEKSLLGRELLGVKVLGNLSDLNDVVSETKVTHAIIAMPSSKHQDRQRALIIANKAHLKVLTVPAFEDLATGKFTVSQIREVELEDLLGRDPINLDEAGIYQNINGKTIFVSGAGGSIGSELCRQILKFQPANLLCFDISEFALYKLEQELSLSKQNTKICYLTGDIKNESKLCNLFNKYIPSMVFHAAAYKHVPLMETNNVIEALNNNVVGTYTLAKVSKLKGVKKFVMVSTDKAVNPTNVMGASKRLAEMVCQGLQEETGTRFVIVRFGNVLGSSGSVIPKFREQIARGGPITVTHPEITRYFMSIPEAAQLVMQAGLMGAGGEIFVLDMGEPVKIVDLAKDMVRLSGLEENEIKIEFTGLRPGEKLYEELLADDEHTLPTPHEKLRIAIARNSDMLLVQNLLVWIAASAEADELIIKQELKMWVEEYSPDLQSVKRDGTVEHVSPAIH